MPRHTADILVIGGGLGGVAAARAALMLGRTVILTETGDWLGGQLTSQGVPPDEHPWIEGEHVSAGYRELRNRVRDFYRRNYPLTAQARSDDRLNPGRGFVSALCHEPRVGAAVLDEMLSPWLAGGQLTLLRGHSPVAARRQGDRVTSVTALDRQTGVHRELTGTFVLDATELGDLLELADIPHVVGAESRAQTGELHAVDRADPMDQQAITWCAAVEYRAGESHLIAEPEGYSHWRDTVDPRWPGPQLSWTDVHPITLDERTRPLFLGEPEHAVHRDDRDLWHYRRIVARSQFDHTFTGGEVTLINWPQTDYWEHPIIGVEAATRRTALHRARELTLSFVFWMQTEAPRADGGHGYPELRLRGDVFGTADGLAREPYIRESRRIKALFTVTEAHIGQEMRGPDAGSEIFQDSVGIGYYRIDLHPSTSGRNYVDIASYPFQIPLGALVPVSVSNLLAANKNVGTTHITNGAYRLHPVEWSIGEAAGAVAAYCLSTERSAAEVRQDSTHVRKLQDVLAGTLGVPLAWPDEIRRTGAPDSE
ncbi:FAD-dependent oxidoreductase [Phytoactinopolyspora halotolerans]|uniref:FAD-dependent oxidoreductase n=1 Tax=Phytoactinopolyspora halotolerans TaxID=1981512 RepID=A0A6L9SJ70_9ACTN|nr:FAD-dependent oxidoreductase [Phytoactinopolyspora halotolerans]NEE04724.1 FAD-dependent oxidoreductase [Phytoactinopolyspora halotolerans]